MRGFVYYYSPTAQISNRVMADLCADDRLESIGNSSVGVSFLVVS